MKILNDTATRDLCTVSHEIGELHVIVQQFIVIKASQC